MPPEADTRIAERTAIDGRLNAIQCQKREMERTWRRSQAATLKPQWDALTAEENDLLAKLAEIDRRPAPVQRQRGRIYIFKY